MTMNLCSCGQDLTTTHTCDRWPGPAATTGGGTVAEQCVHPVLVNNVCTFCGVVPPPVRVPQAQGGVCTYCGQATGTVGHTCARQVRPVYPSQAEEGVLQLALAPYGFALTTVENDWAGLAVGIFWKGQRLGFVQRVELVADCRGLAAKDGTVPNVQMKVEVARRGVDLAPTLWQTIQAACPWLTLVVTG